MFITLYRGLRGFTRVYRGLQGFKRVYRGLQGYTTRIYRGLHGYTGVYNGLQRFTMVYRGMQGFAGEYNKSFISIIMGYLDDYMAGRFMVAYHELHTPVPPTTLPSSYPGL